LIVLEEHGWRFVGTWNLGRNGFRVGAFKLVFCQSYEFVDIFSTTTTAPMFTQAKLSYDLPSGQTALPTGFPHV
jgi:hypothetical protein